jgi:hypothetical protein
MFRAALILVLISFSVGSSGQKKGNDKFREHNCEFNAGLVDSLYAFDWDTLNNRWNLVSIRHYFATEKKYDSLLFLHADRSPERVWKYFYDSNGNRDLEISSTWVNNSWYSTFRKESEFDADNRKLSELQLNFKSSKWIFRSFQYYEYQGDKVDKVHYQLKDNNGVLYDRSYSVYFYTGEKLTEVVGHDGLSGSIIASDRYKYDNATGKLSEVLSLGPEEGGSAGNLVPLKRRLYFYDEYSIQREELFQEMKNGAWVTYHKYVFYYRIDNAGKVAICHNNHTICISINALKAHLAHGDKLGSCNPGDNSENNGSGPEHNKNEKDPCKIYPNPASEYVTVQIDRSVDPGICRLELVDPSGMVLRSFDADQKNEIEIRKGNLRNGQYVLRLTGNKVYSMAVIFR